MTEFTSEVNSKLWLLYPEATAIGHGPDGYLIVLPDDEIELTMEGAELVTRDVTLPEREAPERKPWMRDPTELAAMACYAGQCEA